MSVAYGGPPDGSSYLPPGRVNFGWIGEAFDLFKANPIVWIVAALLAFVPSVIGGIFGFTSGYASARTGTLNPPPYSSAPFSAQTSIMGGLPPGLYFGIQAFNVLYDAWLYGGIYLAAVKQVRGEIISVGDLFSGASSLWRMLGFNIVYGLAVGVGLFLCIVPGLLISGLLFPGYALIAQGESVGTALSRSIDAVKRDMWNAAAFVFILGLLVLVSTIPCGLGLFVTLPILFLTSVLACRDLIGIPGAGPSSPGYGTPTGTWPPAPGTWPPPPAGPSAGQ